MNRIGVQALRDWLPIQMASNTKANRSLYRTKEDSHRSATSQMSEVRVESILEVTFSCLTTSMTLSSLRIIQIKTAEKLIMGNRIQSRFQERMPLHSKFQTKESFSRRRVLTTTTSLMEGVSLARARTKFAAVIQDSSRVPKRSYNI